ncbi:MAG: carbohydrate ABC transporter permease, partial [Clostridia bacterium]|nr:carbohydrate ABC transporter permease [Clostridia bacterium]
MKKKKKYEKNNTVILPVESKNTSSRILYTVIYVILIILAAVCLIPPLWVLFSAFKNINEFYMTLPTIIPHSFEPWKIVEAWTQANFGNAYLNSIWLGAGQLAFDLVFNGLAGYVLSRLKPKGWKFVFTIITWTMMMPHSMNMVPLYMTFIDMPLIHVNLSNTFLPFWIMAGAKPFTILLFKSFFDSIHMSYIEAARMDGCSEIGIFVRIIL